MNNNNSLTLKLTSQNLYDLIDSNELIKFKICNGILENISKRYIKDHLNTISDAINNIIATNVKEMFLQCATIEGYYNYKVSLKSEFAGKIQKSIEEEINNFINRTVENAINHALSVEFMERISNSILETIDYRINDKINNLLNNKINKILGECNEINNNINNINP